MISLSLQVVVKGTVEAMALVASAAEFSMLKGILKGSVNGIFLISDAS